MYYYLSKNAIKNTQSIVIYDQFLIQVNLSAYRTSPGKDDAILYIGDSIPSDLIYDDEYDVVFSEKDRPSPYHVYLYGKWVIKDEENFNRYVLERLSEVKQEILNEGFTYETFKQKYREKDVIYITSSIIAFQHLQDTQNINKTLIWYFDDENYKEMNLNDLKELLIKGTLFINSVFYAEHYFKSQKVFLQEVTKDTFLSKMQEYNTLQN